MMCADNRVDGQRHKAGLAAARKKSSKAVHGTRTSTRFPCTATRQRGAKGILRQIAANERGERLGGAAVGGQCGGVAASLLCVCAAYKSQACRRLSGKIDPILR